jgi:hypothetical protein
MLVSIYMLICHSLVNTVSKPAAQLLGQRFPALYHVPRPAHAWQLQADELVLSRPKFVLVMKLLWYRLFSIVVIGKDTGRYIGVPVWLMNEESFLLPSIRAQ